MPLRQCTDRLSVRLMDLKTGAVRNLTEKVDLSFSSLVWSADGKSLVATNLGVALSSSGRSTCPAGRTPSSSRRRRLRSTNVMS